MIQVFIWVLDTRISNKTKIFNLVELKLKVG